MPFRPKHRGPKRQQGTWVTQGTVLALQTKPRFFPGLNVSFHSDFLEVCISIAVSNSPSGRFRQKLHADGQVRWASCRELRKDRPQLQTASHPAFFLRTARAGDIQEILQCSSN